MTKSKLAENGTEKLQIISFSDEINLLNWKSKLISKCRHDTTFYYSIFYSRKKN